MAEEAVQKTRLLGTRQRAISALERALSEFLPDHSRTPAEKNSSARYPIAYQKC